MTAMQLSKDLHKENTIMRSSYEETVSNKRENHNKEPFKETLRRSPEKEALSGPFGNRGSPKKGSQTLPTAATAQELPIQTSGPT